MFRNINEHNPNSSRTNSHQQGGGRGTKKRKQVRVKMFFVLKYVCFS